MADRRVQWRGPTEFGRLLKRYRTRGPHAVMVPVRCNCTSGWRPQMIGQLVTQMNWLGCEVTLAAYSDIEERHVLPAEPERFFEAVVRALDLCEHESLELLMALAFTVLEIELGDDITAGLVKGKGEWSN